MTRDVPIPSQPRTRVREEVLDPPTPRSNRREGLARPFGRAGDGARAQKKLPNEPNSVASRFDAYTNKREALIFYVIFRIERHRRAC